MEGIPGPPDPRLIPAPPSEGAKSHAHAFAGVGIALNVVGFLVISGRIWTRSFPVFRMGPDDYVIMVAYILVLVDSILLLMTVPYAFGMDPSTFTLADSQTSNRYAVLAQPIWAWSMASIKTSVALMLLRLETSKPMRRFLWANIAIQGCLGLYNTLTQVLQCIPLHAAWDLLGIVEAKCWSKEAIRINTICVSAVNVATDILFALLPVSFLRKVQRPLRERIIIGVLMALGIFAAVASVMKLVAGARFGTTNDFNREGIEIGMWSCIEELVGLIAACVPCLRSPFQRVLEYFGLATTHATSTYGRGYGNVTSSKRRNPSWSRKSGGGLSGSMSSALGIRMNNMRSPDEQSEENILPCEDQKGANEIWCTTEVYLMAEDSKVSSVTDAEQARRM